MAALSPAGVAMVMACAGGGAMTMAAASAVAAVQEESNILRMAFLHEASPFSNIPGPLPTQRYQAAARLDGTNGAGLWLMLENAAPGSHRGILIRSGVSNAIRRATS